MRHNKLLRFFLSDPHANLQNLIFLFLGHRPHHTGKLHLVTHNRCCA
ncbi:hypothetical protein [Kluyvera ascorbata]